MKNVGTNLDLKPSEFSEALQVDLLHFADDTILLGQASWANLWAIKVVLRGFELPPGLSVNFHKSKIMGFNVD